MPQPTSSATPHDDDGGGPVDPGTRHWCAQPLAIGADPLHTEAAAVLALYSLYEVARGLVVGNAAEAVRHARGLAATERSLHLLLEARLQSAVHALPGLTSLLAAAYVTLHVTVTAAALLWLHQRRPAAFPFVRTMLLLASGLSLVGFLAYPVAPPRLAGIGIADTASHGPIDLNHGLVNSLYNPTPPSPACTSDTPCSSP